MVNSERIVPITSMDFISMIGTIMTLDGTSFTLVESSSVPGDFTVSTGNSLLNQPAGKITFSGSSATVYFVADYNGVEFYKSSTDLTISGEAVCDGITLNKAVLSSGTVTITQVTPAQS